jgi:2-aminoadipate transaminase
MPGFAFYCEPQNDSYLRLNFSHANPDKIEEGVKRLAKLLAEWPAE